MSSGFVVGVDSSVVIVVDVVSVVSPGAIVDCVVTLDSGVTVVPVVCPGIRVVGVDWVSGLSVVGYVDDVSPGLIVVSVVGNVCEVVVSGFIVVIEVGVDCPGVVEDCCGGGVVVSVNVVISGFTVVIVLEEVSCGFTVDEDSGFVVDAVVGIVCPGDWVVGLVVSCGFTVDEASGFVVVAVVGVVCSGDCVGGVVVSAGFAVEEDPGFVVATVVGVVCPGNC